MANKCGDAHIDPKQWKKGHCKDGTIKHYCKVCGKWLGSLPPLKDQK